MLSIYSLEIVNIFCAFTMNGLVILIFKLKSEYFNILNEILTEITMIDKHKI